MRGIPILLIGLLACAGMAWAQVRPLTALGSSHTLAVTGSAERMVAPDVAVIIFAVQTQADTVTRATAENNTATNQVITAVHALTVTGLTIRTMGFDLQPMYEQFTTPPNPPRNPRIIGFQVVNRVEARVVDIVPAQLSTDTGRVLDAALTAGANRVDSLQFTLNNERPLLRELQAEAMRDAASNARAIATAANVKLGVPVSISASTYYPPPSPGPFLERAEAVNAASVPIEAGQMNVSTTVQVVFEIR